MFIATSQDIDVVKESYPLVRVIYNSKRSSWGEENSILFENDRILYEVIFDEHDNLLTYEDAEGNWFDREIMNGGCPFNVPQDIVFSTKTQHLSTNHIAVHLDLKCFLKETAHTKRYEQLDDDDLNDDGRKMFYDICDVTLLHNGKIIKPEKIYDVVTTYDKTQVKITFMIK